jgi:AGZA family xanthine/uracil permease-like MFS transporter
LAGVCGGVAQSTPYIGQPAYKAMGARLGYTAMTGIFVGLGGIVGYLGFFTKLIPEAVLAPILVFVALDIVVQAFQASPARHAPAVALAFIPTIARLVAIQIDQLSMHLGKAMPDLLKPGPEGISDIQSTISLGNGFILTAMLWGGCIAELIDRRVARASVYLFILAGLSLPGIIHSALPSGKMYNPTTLTPELALVPYHFAGGYLVLGIIFWLLSFTPESKEPPDESAGHGGHFG